MYNRTLDALKFVGIMGCSFMERTTLWDGNQIAYVLLLRHCPGFERAWAVLKRREWKRGILQTSWRCRMCHCVCGLRCLWLGFVQGKTEKAVYIELCISLRVLCMHGEKEGMRVA